MTQERFFTRLYRLFQFDWATQKLWRVYQHLPHLSEERRLVWDLLSERLRHRETL